MPLPWISLDRVRALWNPVRLSVDEPRSGQEYAAYLSVRGWALSLDGARLDIAILANGTELARLMPVVQRDDVARIYPGAAGSLCGFEDRFRRADLPDEPEFTLEVQALRNGKVRRFLRIPVRRHATSVPAHDRQVYRDVWDAEAVGLHKVRYAVAGKAGSQEWHRSGVATAATLLGALRITHDDTVLEIGCGAGRIGAHLAPHCKRWIGGDVSPAMLEHAGQELAALDNVELVQLSGYDLTGIRDASVDAIYCSGVLMHLDEWDRFRYFADAHRALRPGGRVYFDNINLAGDEGWAIFRDLAALDPMQRRPNISKVSTDTELATFAERAGFESIRVLPGSLWIAVTGSKPAAAVT
jgi:SAM-dependent methyltransferase